MSMNSVAELVTDKAVKRLATPTDFEAGLEIADTNGVRFTEFDPLRIQAHVSGPSTPPCETLLEATPAGLRWQCTCSPHKAHFCPHLVATAIETWRKTLTHHH